MFKILGIITMIVVILVLGGCAAAMFSMGDTLNDNQQSADDFALVADQVKLGMTMDEVRTIAGEPDSDQHSESEFAGTKSVSDYWYYGVLAEDGYQLAFEDGVLRSVNRN
jgi:hypothetical protein